jgi:hypothetical protein
VTDFHPRGLHRLLFRPACRIIPPVQMQFQKTPEGGSPTGVRVVHESLNVTRYLLPARNLGAARKIGWIPFGFGVVVATFMAFWMHGAMAGCLGDHGPVRWIGIFFGLTGLPGLAVGVGLMALGLAILTDAARSEIVVGEGMICAIERIWWVPIRRRRFVSQLTRFVVEKGGIRVTDGNRHTTTTLAKDMASLRAEVSTGKPFLMAIAYPYEVLRPLADTLAASLSLGRSTTEEEAPGIEVVEQEAGAPPADTEIPRPAGTNIVCRAEPQGLAISVPPRGLWKGSQGLFFFSLLWNGSMVLMTVLTARGHAPVPVYLFLSLFWAIGLGLLAGAIHMGKRKVMIAVVNDVLACRTIGPFRTSERKVPLAGIDTIRVGPSGMEVNDRPVMEVQIIPRQGRKIGLISNVTMDEMNWLAWTLRQPLKQRRQG